MQNLDLNKKEIKKSIFEYIPGFRSNKIIKKIIASMYYLFFILMIFMSNSIGEILIAIGMILNFIIACGIIDLIFNKEYRNKASIMKRIVTPFVLGTICMFSSVNSIISIEEEAAAKLGISIEEYKNTIDNYNNDLEEYNKLLKIKKEDQTQYKDIEDKYNALVNDFESYKELISEESIKEVESLKSSNENLKNKVSTLNSKISELENKLK